MAKRLLLNALISVLGEYIDLNEDNLNLNLAVWSGQIVLNNLKLKTDKLLENFNLNIVHGTISRLEIIIPWTALLNSPVKIVIDGIYLQIGPLKSTNRDEIKRRILNRKLEKLKLSDRMIDYNSTSTDKSDSNNKSSSSSSTYVQQITTKIIDNLEIRLNDIHLRYEDSESIPNSCLSIGITLDSFILASCDENWKVSYVARSNNSKTTKLHKIAEMKCFSIYWNTNSEQFQFLKYNEWVDKMNLLIYKSNNVENYKKLSHIMKPSNNLMIKMTHCIDYNDIVPKYNFSIESTNLFFILDTLQYKQFDILFNIYNFSNHKHFLRSYRPKERPIKNKIVIKLWWKYALKLIIKKSLYINTFKISKLTPELLTKQQKDLLDDLHELIPAHVLMIFRQIAIKEIQQIINNSSKTNITNNVDNSWWKWTNKPTNPSNNLSSKVNSTIQNSSNNITNLQTTAINIDEEDVSIDTILDNLKTTDDTSNNISTQSLLFQISLYSSVAIELKHCNQSIIKSSMSITSQLQISSIGKSSLKIIAYSFILSYNRSCILMLLGLINLLNVNINQINDSIIQTDLSVNPNLNQASQPYHCDISIFAHSSKIIIPEDSMSDKGFMLIDTGNCDIKGYFKNVGMYLNISLKDIHAALPLLVNEIFALDHNLLYLIKPFDIDINIGTINKTVADMTIDLLFQPEIRGELDPGKLARLFHVIQLVTSTFNQAPDLTSEINRFIRRYSLGREGKNDVKISTSVNINMSQIEEEDDEEAYMTPRNTPPESSLSSPKQSTVTRILNEFATIMPTKLSNIPVIDPLKITMLLKCNLPKVVLDLTYNTEDGLHLVLVLSSTEIEIITRCYDMHISFDMKELVLQDSLRCENQRNLAKTPKDCTLIHITYVSISDCNSPYYDLCQNEIMTIGNDEISSPGDNGVLNTTDIDRANSTYIKTVESISAISNAKYSYATNVEIQFADLELNCDVNTLSHLKPFTEVLLYMRSGNPSILTTSNYTTATPIKKKLNILEKESVGVAPTGMRILFHLDRIALMLLKPANNKDVIGLPLQRAFLLQVTKLYIEINMKTLMDSIVTLKSFDIVDQRDISQDYAYHTILSPSTDNINSNDNSNSNLLTIVYKQEHAFLTFIRILVSNVKALVSIDSILDLSDVLLGNFFAILDLLASPSPNKLISLYKKYLVHYNNSSTVNPLSNHPSSTQNSANPTITRNEKSSDQFIEKENPNGSMIYTMNIEVQIKSPQLLLLEDPTSEETQAIVGKCEVEIVYTREVKMVPINFSQNELLDAIYDRFVNESINILNKELHVFVLDNILPSISSTSKAILEPFDIVYNIKRRIVNQCTVLTSITIEIDTIIARLSIEDILLFQKIMIRRLVSTVVVDDNGFEDNLIDYKSCNDVSSNIGNESTKIDKKIGGSLDSNSVDKSDELSTAAVSSELQFHLLINLENLNLTTINDHINLYSYPLFQTNIHKFTFVLGGIIGKQLSGRGAFTYLTDYYNTRIDQWEVLIERWQPSISIDITDKNTTIDIQSTHTLMVTLSNYVLEKLIEIYSYFTYKDKYNYSKDETNNQVTKQRIEHLANDRVTPDIIIINDLGSDIKLSVNNSENNLKLLDLIDGTPMFIPKIISHIDLKFPWGQSISCLPIYSNTTNQFYLGLSNIDSVDLMIIEPIIEEIYENSRYDIITGLWRLPFLFGDPEEYTNKSMSKRKDLSSLRENEDKWEYLDSWTVDMQGIVDVEIDKEGWEYSNSFNNFTSTSLRHSQQPLDCIRRRRWIRSRIPKLNNNSTYLSYPLNIIYESKVLSSGNRQVMIRSNRQITNNLSYDIEILLSCNLWDQKIKLGPISAYQTVNLPLNSSQATHIKIRPYEKKYQWCNSVYISLQGINYVLTKDISCEIKTNHNLKQNAFVNESQNITNSQKYSAANNNQNLESAENFTNFNPAYSSSEKYKLNLSYIPVNKEKSNSQKSSQSSNHLIRFNLIVNIVNKSLTLSCSPYIVIKNALPCDFIYRIYQSNQLLENSDIISGDSRQLSHTNPTMQMYLSIKIGKYADSPLHLIDLMNINNKVTNNIILSNSSNEINAMLSLDIKLNEYKCYELTVYSKSALIDKTGLDLSIWCNINANGDLSTTRNTFNYSDYQLDSLINSFSSSRIDALDNKFDNSFDITIPHSVDSKVDTAVDTSALPLTNFKVDSLYNYSITRLHNNTQVYSDRSSITWKYLPKHIRRGHPLVIQPSFNDKMSRSKELISFQLSITSIVVLLVDIRLIEKHIAPRWITEDGFEQISGQAVASRLTSNNKIIEYFYGFYGKIIDCRTSNQEVILKGNWNKIKGHMYSIIIINDPNDCNAYPMYHSIDKNDTNRNDNNIDYKRDDMKREVSLESTSDLSTEISNDRSAAILSTLQLDYNKLYEQLVYKSISIGKLKDNWINGGLGLTLFHSFNDLISIGILQQKVWSEAININVINKNDGNINIIDWNTYIEYQLYYHITFWPSILQSSQVLTIYPKYCIVNCLTENIYIAQRRSGFDKFITVSPFSTEPWHKIDTNLGNILHIRTQTTNWSYGTIDITGITSTILYLPSQSVNDMNNSEHPFIIHAEVKRANFSNNENCEYVVIIKKSVVNSVTNTPILSVRNESDVEVTICQADIDKVSLGSDPKLFEVVVHAGQWIPYGWIDPDGNQQINIIVGNSLSDDNPHIRHTAMINPLETGELIRLSDHSGRFGTSGEVIVSMIVDNGGRILNVSRQPSIPNPYKSKHLSSYKTNILLNLQSFGLSLVFDKPKRREFLSLYIDKFIGAYTIEGLDKSIELCINDIQIDNYSESMIYPILLRSKSKNVNKLMSESDNKKDNDLSRKKKDANTLMDSTTDYSLDGNHPIDIDNMNPWFTMSISNSSNSFDISIDLLTTKINIDTATIQLIYFDLIKGLLESTVINSYIVLHSSKWIEKYNYNLSSPYNKQSINVYNSLLYNQSINKLYIKKLTISQVKVYLTIVPTPFPRPIEDDDTLQVAVLNMLKEFTAIDSLPIRIRCFEVEGALETIDSLLLYISTQVKSDITISLSQVFGYLSLIGSPMTFAKKIGKGVKAFFYEPYLGAVQSPQDFILGIGKGTSTLLNNVVTGTLDSTISVVGTAGKSMSYLSGDPEYIRKRAIKRQKYKASKPGLFDSLIDGSESIASGIKSGVTGLVTKPMEEVNKSGPLGLFKGIGLGLLGIAVKPVMGITDGLTSVANGISNTIGDNLGVSDNQKDVYVRPTRVFQRSLYNINELIISPLDLNANDAQAFILNRAKTNGYSDSYLDYMALDFNNDALILSTAYLFYKKNNSLFGRKWSVISHIVCLQTSNSYDVHVILYANQFDVITISLVNKSQCISIYTFLSKYTYLMGNPSLVIPTFLLHFVDKSMITNELSLADKIRNINWNCNKSFQRSINLLAEVDKYKFGFKNGIRLPFVFGLESDLLLKSQKIFHDRYNNKELDERCYRMIWEWECIHTTMRTKCLLSIIINKSQYCIQINTIELISGKDLKLFGSLATGYNSDISVILPNGYIILFIIGSTSLNIDIQINLKSTIFDIILSSDISKSSIQCFGGFTSGFLEKTCHDWWNKYALYID